MNAFQGDKVRGHLETMILSVLERGEGHGLEILDRLERAGCGMLRFKEGSLYPALYRLEAAGRVEAAWETGDHGRRGARRRIYRLTSKGKRELHKGRVDWQQFTQIVGGILGSISMNNTTLTQLKIIVERAVRPVRARSSRLRGMREDLLAHAVAVFEEEFEQLHDEQAAIHRVAERMGDATVLSRRLQETVPVTELLTWRFEHLLRMRRGERPIRRAARHGLLMFLMMGTVHLVIGVPVMVAQDRTRELPLLLAMTIIYGGMGFAFTLLNHGAGSAGALRSSGPSWWRVILVGAITCLSIFAGMGLFCLTGLHDARLVFTDPVLLRSTLILAVLSPIGLVALAWQTAKDIRYAEEWGSLQIGE